MLVFSLQTSLEVVCDHRCQRVGFKLWPYVWEVWPRVQMAGSWGLATKYATISHEHRSPGMVPSFLNLYASFEGWFPASKVRFEVFLIYERFLAQKQRVRSPWKRSLSFFLASNTKCAGSSFTEGLKGWFPASKTYSLVVGLEWSFGLQNQPTRNCSMCVPRDYFQDPT